MTSPPGGPGLPIQLRIAIQVAKLSKYGDWFVWVEQEGVFRLQWNAPYELREVDLAFTRDVSGAPVDDRALITFHLLNLTGGSPDSTWTTGDFTAAEALFDTWWGWAKQYYRPETKLVEYVWRADGPSFRPHGTDLSPVLRRVSRSVVGTNAGTGGMLPPQVALSVTERTAAKFTAEDVEGVGDQLRNRWGRFYMPNPGQAENVNGRPSSNLRGELATNTATLYNGLRAADLIPVMYSPTTGSAWSVDAVAVDDVWDVIRSRRWRNVINRSVATTTGP